MTNTARVTAIKIGAAILLILAVLFAYQKCSDSGDESDRQREESVDSVKAVIDTQTTALTKADGTVTRIIHEYRDWRGSAVPIRNDAGASAPTLSTALGQCINYADSIASSCELRTARANELERSLRAEIELLEKRPKRAPPRWQTYAEGGYDFVHSSPQIAVGSDFRLFENTYVTARSSILTAIKGAESTRASVGIRVTFR